MPTDPTKRPLDNLRDIAKDAEAELRRLATYINDEVVPDVRRNGSVALRAVSAELQRLAERIEESKSHTPPTP